MANLRDLAFGVKFGKIDTSPIDKANKSMDSLKTSMQNTGKKMSSVGKTMMKSVTLPIVGVGVAAMKTVMDFDDSMANVQKISGATGKEFDDLRDKAKELGRTTAFSASEASQGMGVLAASGMATNDILATSGDMFNLMSAGSVSAETAASVLTNTMAQFNIGADKSGYIVDTFAATSAKAKVSVDDLEHAMAISGGTLASMNMDVHESTAALGHLANAGTPVAQIGTIVNAMGREVKANAKDFKKIGIDVYDPVTGKLKDMGTVMGEVEKAVEGKTDAQRDEILSSVFSGQAMKGATDWINQGSEAYAKLTDEIMKESKAAETMAAIQEDTVGGAFRAMKSATEGFMIEIGDVLKEPLQKGALFIADLAGKFGELSEPAKKMIVVAAGIAAALGPVLFIGGKILTLMGALMSPITLIVLGIGALIAVVVHLWKTNEQFRDKVIEIWEVIQTKLGEALEFIKSLWEAHGETIKTTVMEIFTRVGDIVMGAFEIIVEVISIAVSWISEFWSEHGELIKEIASSAWSMITGIIDGAMTVIQGVIDLVLGIIKGDWEQAWTGMQGIFEGVMDAVSAAWNFVKDLLSKAIKGAVNAITDKFHTAMDSVKEKWESIKEFMRNPIKGTVSLAKKGAGWVSEKLGFSHKTGAYNIPYDNYPASLHKGEMVLTANASDQYRSMGGTEDSVPTTTTSNSSGGKSTGSMQINFNPSYNIEVNGTMEEREASDLLTKIDRQTKKSIESFFHDLQLQMG